MTHIHGQKNSWEKQVRKGVDVHKNNGACKHKRNLDILGCQLRFLIVGQKGSQKIDVKTTKNLQRRNFQKYYLV